MKPGGSKAKGSRGERQVAELLTSITGAVWKRVPCSGAMFTTGAETDFKGDVYCRDEFFDDVVVEVKNHCGVVSINDFFNEKSKLNSWIVQMKDESVGCFGVLFFKSGGKWFWYYVDPAPMNMNHRFLKLLKENSLYWRCWGMLR